MSVYGLLAERKMKLRSLLMVGALLLGGCAVNPYGGTQAPVSEPDQPVSQPDKPVTKPDAGAPLPKPVAPTGLALAMADAFVKAAEVRSWRKPVSRCCCSPRPRTAPASRWIPAPWRRP